MHAPAMFTVVAAVCLGPIGPTLGIGSGVVVPKAARAIS
jgi:hypothetical protein